MPELAASEYLIVLYYNPNSPTGSQTLAYAKGAGFQLRDVDILKNHFTGTQLEELAESLGVTIDGLVNKEHSDFMNYKNVDFSDVDWIKILRKTPQLIKEPIAVRGTKAIFVKTPSDMSRL